MSFHSVETQVEHQPIHLSYSNELAGCASKTTADIAKELRTSENKVLSLVKQGYLVAIPLGADEYRFPPNALERMWAKLEEGCSRTEPTEHEAESSSIGAHVDTAKEKSTPNSIVSIPIDVIGRTRNADINLETTSNQVVAVSEEFSVKNGPISMEVACDFEKSKSLANGRRVLPIDCNTIKGLKLELSARGRKLVVKSKENKRFARCVLHEWNNNESINYSLLQKIVEKYAEVCSKLDRRPSTEEFKLHCRAAKTIGDVLNIHKYFNILPKHGEGSPEWKQIDSLIRNHLSTERKIVLPNKQTEFVTLNDVPFHTVSFAWFKAYLASFKDTNGVHDKIVSRVKAAFNFSIQDKVISYEHALPFLRQKRINRERHVVVEDKHLKQIFEYLEEYPNRDFVHYMYILSSGHLRKTQIMTLRFSDFNFNDAYVTVKPKNGESTTIYIPADIVELVKERQEQFRLANNEVDYIFPSSQSGTGHVANFDNHWYQMLEEFELFTKNSKGETEYTYIQHDFRETLLDRLDDFDDFTLASVLGHLSLHNVKNYRKANRKKSKVAAEAGSILTTYKHSE